MMVTNGYITREAFHDIYDHVDAANVDLKAFTENFYGRSRSRICSRCSNAHVAQAGNKRMV